MSQDPRSLAARPQDAAIAVVGVGRMGIGIAVSYAFAGLPVALIDAKPRHAPAQDAVFDGVRQALRAELDTLAQLGLLAQERIDPVLARITLHERDAAAAPLRATPVVFEAVPERLDAKRDVFGWLGERIGADCVLASTTSTFLVTQLADAAPDPARFLNAHWLNPAHLIPLVEVSPGPDTLPEVVDGLEAVLRQAHKVPVRCSPSAGYIVPRIQALAMNEAARMVEEGVASAEDIDTAVRLGFGLRFSVLGLLEFIDWGGNDILYYASRYLDVALGPRFQAPAVIERNMEQGRNGLRDGLGFYDYRDQDVAAYRLRRLGELVRRLEVMGHVPREGTATRQPT